MSAEWGTRSPRGRQDTVQLPCGHDVPLEERAILIEMSAAILEHQRGCGVDPAGRELYPTARSLVPAGSGFGASWA